MPHGLRVHNGRKHKEVASRQAIPVPHVATVEPPIGDLSSMGFQNLLVLKTKIRVLKHVPKGARNLAAGKLTRVIERCLETNSVEDWLTLMTFAFTALKLPDRGNGNLTTKVKANIDKCQLDLPSESVSRKPPSVYRAVEAKVYEGDLRGAARLLTSDCSVAPANEHTLTALKEKHPASSRPFFDTPDPDPSTTSLTVKVEDIVSALQSFHRGSASGLDGIRPEHLKELVSPSAGDNGPRLLEVLTRLCNFLLSGSLNTQVCPFLYGASLCALKKKDGGIRPIAVGNTIRRLVAKLGCRAVKAPMASYLQPHQVGFGTTLGCEAAIHATRTFALRKDNNNVILKLDIKNAFNSIERDAVLKEASLLTPSIYPFVRQCYAMPSNLAYNNASIMSRVGVQQGDPLGPLIFSLAIHKAIESLGAPLNIWYLDDGTIGGSPETVERDVKALFPALMELGLEINTAKCELFFCSPVAAETCDRFLSLIPGLRVVDFKSLSLLGAPVFLEGVPDALSEKTRNLESLSVHLHQLPAHVSLTLLRTCLAMPKLTYVVRTAPTWEYPEHVTDFDNCLKNMLQELMNINLSENQWRQAGLPIRYGGLGVRRLREVGPIAFLASANGTTELVTSILSCNGDELLIPFVAAAARFWSGLYPNVTPPEKPAQQRHWDDMSSKIILGQLREESTGVDSARLNSVVEPEAGAWLHALPSPHIGTLLDDDSLRVAVALRLGCSVCEPHDCICGARVEANGHHGLSCTRCAGRRPRHFAINEILKRALVAAEVPCILEPPGLSRSDGKRPDGLTLVPWRNGRCLVWDATCVSTFASCHLPATQQSAGAGAEAAAKGKHLKYACLEPAYEVVPFAVETAGPWGREAKKFIRDLGCRLRKRGRDPRSGEFLVQHISLAIQRGNAGSVMGTLARANARKFDL